MGDLMDIIKRSSNKKYPKDCLIELSIPVILSLLAVKGKNG